MHGFTARSVPFVIAVIERPAIERWELRILPLAGEPLAIFRTLLLYVIVLWRKKGIKRHEQSLNLIQGGYFSHAISPAP